MTAGALQLASLTGSEQVTVDNSGSVIVQATTAQIAGLGSKGGTSTGITNTAITTLGAGVLTGAGLVGGLITRTGPVAAYIDTTDTAANIVAALPSFVLGATFLVRIKNATSFLQTLAAGTNVTLPLTNVVGPWEEENLYGIVGGTAAVPTITLNHLLTTGISLAQGVVSPAATALNTVGAGTVLAAAINGGIVVRGGSQTNTAFADTTDTAANIIAGNPGLVGKIGSSVLVLYQNTTNANVTLGGGAGVTVSGITVIPAGSAALYVLTYTAAATLTMVGVLQTAPTTASGTFVANGVTPVVVADTRITANSVVSFGLKTAGGTASAPFMTAVTPGTGFSVAAAAANTGTYNYQING